MISRFYKLFYSYNQWKNRSHLEPIKGSPLVVNQRSCQSQDICPFVCSFLPTFSFLHLTCHPLNSSLPLSISPYLSTTTHTYTFPVMKLIGIEICVTCSNQGKHTYTNTHRLLCQDDSCFVAVAAGYVCIIAAADYAVLHLHNETETFSAEIKHI